MQRALTSKYQRIIARSPKVWEYDHSQNRINASIRIVQPRVHNRARKVIIFPPGWEAQSARESAIRLDAHAIRFSQRIKCTRKTKSQRGSWCDAYVMRDTMCQAEWYPWKAAIHHFPQMIIVRSQLVEKRIVSYLPTRFVLSMPFQQG